MRLDAPRHRLLPLCMTLLGLGLPSGSLATATGVTYYVDDDAPNDPGPNDPNVSDPLEDGSEGHPFDSIQEALDALLDPCSLIVRAGVYDESLQLSTPRCVIAGSGRTATLIRPLTNPAFNADIHSYPSVPASLSLRDLTLQGGQISISTYTNATVGSPPSILFDNVNVTGDLLISGDAGDEPGDALQVTIQNAEIAGDLFRFYASSAPGIGGRMTMLMRSTTLTANGTILSSSGTQLDVRLDAVSVGAGVIELQALHADLSLQLDAVVAPTTDIFLVRANGGSQTVSVRDSAIGGISSSSPGSWLRATMSNVRFTHNGVVALEPLAEISIADSVFENGGILVQAQTSGYVETDVNVAVSRSIFRAGGIDVGAFFSPVMVPSRYAARFDVNSCIFSRSGVLASFGSGHTSGQSGASIGLTVTNSLFHESPVGFDVTYYLYDPDPLSEPAELRATLVNNTFVGCGTAVRSNVDPYVLGPHTAVTLIKNNVVAGGDTGIEIQGAEDHLIAISGNDVYGNNLADYQGDLPDQTGLSGNISADPLFADPNAGDFHLLAGSSCIDAGIAGPEVPAADLEGVTRPQDGNGDGISAPDMGALEFVLDDDDHDGYPVTQDCNDADPSIHPGAVDLPGNTLDEDCSGLATCDASVLWKSHGQFVSCVAQACGALVKAGSVTQADCSMRVSQAAQSSVGRRQHQRHRPAPQEP